jgi:hypothetical protein
MNRIPRKIKKRRKKADIDRMVKEIMSEVLIKQLNEHYQQMLPEIFPILRINPLTLEQKRAMIEADGGTIELLTIEECAKRYDLTEEEIKALLPNRL